MIDRTEGTGFHLTSVIGQQKDLLRSIIGVDQNLESMELINLWVNESHLTWKDFFNVMENMKLNNLADDIESYLKGALVEVTDNTEYCVEENEEEVKAKGRSH